MLLKKVIDLNELALQAQARVKQEKLSRGYVSIGVVAYAVRLRVEALRAQLEWERDQAAVNAPDVRPVMDRLQTTMKGE